MDSSSVPPRLLTLEVVPSGPGRRRGARPRPSSSASLRIGVRLSLDDFGRASSLAALRQLPLDEVKIDAYFVHALDRHRADAAVVRALDRSRATELDLDVVAEGVESREIWDELCSARLRLRAGLLHRRTAHVGRRADRMARAQLAGRGRAGVVGAVRRSPPGRQSGSTTPANAFAVRARMKSRSERRLR